MSSRHQASTPIRARAYAADGRSAALATPGATDARTRAIGLKAYGEELLHIEQYERTYEPLQESLALYQELGDRSGEASILQALDMAAWAQGRIHQAIELGEAALAIYSDLGDRVALAGLLHTQGDVALDGNDPQRAAANYRQALEIAVELSDERTGMYSVAGLACAAALRGDNNSAGRLWGAVEGVENRLEMRILAAERVRYERILTPRAPDELFHAGYTLGRNDDLASALEQWA